MPDNDRPLSLFSRMRGWQRLLPRGPGHGRAICRCLSDQGGPSALAELSAATTKGVAGGL